MKLKFGMVGGGNGAFIGNVHRRAAVMDDLAVLVSGCFTRNARKNLETAREWGVQDESRVYTDYRQMAENEGIREDGIDFVSITTPNDTHYEIAKCFIAQGIHVMCDKPLSLTAAEGAVLKVTKINEPPQIYTATRDYVSDECRGMSRLPSGHPEGFCEAFANIYRGFCMHLTALKEGNASGAYWYPTVEDGVRGIRFVEACINSNTEGNVWMKLN